MTRVNAVLAAGIVVLFVIHAVSGAFLMTGAMPGGNMVLKVLSQVMLCMVCAHVVIGCVLTGRSIVAWRKSGVAYFSQNKLFWARRISGLAVLVLIVAHVTEFLGTGQGISFRLNLFDTTQLVFALLFVACLAVHVLCNIKPALISLGAVRTQRFSGDILAVLSIVLLVAAVAFVIYFIRWVAI